MKCKLQQPIKDFIFSIIIIFGMLMIVLYLPVFIGFILVHLELGLDLILYKHLYESPEAVYRALGIVWLTIVLVGGLTIGLVYNILKLLYILTFKLRLLKVWFKENIYNCEGY